MLSLGCSSCLALHHVGERGQTNSTATARMSTGARRRTPHASPGWTRPSARPPAPCGHPCYLAPDPNHQQKATIGHEIEQVVAPAMRIITGPTVQLGLDLQYPLLRLKDSVLEFVDDHRRLSVLVVGAIKAVAAHPTNPDIVYVGSVNGGVWRTGNPQSATRPGNSSPMPSGRCRVGALEFDPTDSKHRTLVAGRRPGGTCSSQRMM